MSTYRSITRNVLAGSAAAMLVASLNIGSLHAQTPSKRKSAGELAAASRLLSGKNESCRQQARAQHLHLLKRLRFMRICRRRP
jgi:hypothetical protein